MRRFLLKARSWASRLIQPENPDPWKQNQFPAAKIWWSLVPFPIYSLLSANSRSLPRPTDTSYVNGLRGMACAVVYTQHSMDTDPHRAPIFTAWGINDGNMSVFQLPLVRLLFSGGFMVSLFFVLSGFVLGYAPLKKIACPGPGGFDGNALLTSLSSSLFRRAFRLFVPMIEAVILTAVLTWCFPIFNSHNILEAEGHPGFFRHIYIWIRNVAPMMNPFHFGFEHPSGFPHGWTLAMEYRGSLVVFGTSLLVCRLQRAWFRKVVLAWVTIYSLIQHRWEIFCFLEGMAIAELRHSPIGFSLHHLRPLFTLVSRHSRGASDPEQGLILRPYSPVDSDSSAETIDGGQDHKAIMLPAVQEGGTKQSRLSLFTWSMLLLISLLIGGWPQFGYKAGFPYSILYPLTPSSWHANDNTWPHPTKFFWISQAAGLCLLSLEHLPSYRSFLDTKALVYLGEISYALYLVHLPLLSSLGGYVYRWLTSGGPDVAWSSRMAWWGQYGIVSVTLFWVADLFWRGADEPAVRWTRRFAIWAGIRSEKGKPVQYEIGKI